MNKLLAITVLGLVIGLSNFSFAVNFVETNVKTKDSRELSTEVAGGKVETSPMSFYFNPAQKGTSRKRTVSVTLNEEPTLFVFGIGL